MSLPPPPSRSAVLNFCSEICRDSSSSSSSARARRRPNEQATQHDCTFAATAAAQCLWRKWRHKVEEGNKALSSPLSLVRASVRPSPPFPLLLFQSAHCRVLVLTGQELSYKAKDALRRRRRRRRGQKDCCCCWHFPHDKLRSVKIWGKSVTM